MVSRRRAALARSSNLVFHRRVEQKYVLSGQKLSFRFRVSSSSTAPPTSTYGRRCAWGAEEAPNPSVRSVVGTGLLAAPQRSNTCMALIVFTLFQRHLIIKLVSLGEQRQQTVSPTAISSASGVPRRARRASGSFRSTLTSVRSPISPTLLWGCTARERCPLAAAWPMAILGR